MGFINTDPALMKRRNFLKISLPALFANQLMGEPAKDADPELRFGVIADPQYADAEAKGSRFYRNSIKKLTTAITELNKHELDFTVTLGDVIDRDLKSFNAILPIYKKAKAPQTFVLGNHDFEVADEDKAKVLPTIGLEKIYYSQSVGDWHFIYLDGNDVSLYRHPKDDAITKLAKKTLNGLKILKKPQARPWNGAIGEAQMQWLAEQLDLAKKTNKRVIVFNHFPVFPLNNGHNLWNDHELVELLTSYKNVAAYMNGHNHRGNYAVHKGCHFINCKGMVEGRTATPFAIVKCYADRIEVDGFGTEPDRDLSS
jgi:predicted phosphodiesterase